MELLVSLHGSRFPKKLESPDICYSGKTTQRLLYLTVCHTGPVGNKLIKEGIYPRYIKIHEGLRDHLNLAILCHRVLHTVES